MGIPDEIRDLLLEEDEDITTVFCSHLEEIFTCTKNDIALTCDQINKNRLSDLRDGLFLKLSENNASIAGYELIRRKKKNILIEDIYVLGYSLVSSLEDRRLKKIFKSEGTVEDSVNMSDIDTDDRHNIILQMLAELKCEHNKLQKYVKSLESRVDVLETEVAEIRAESRKQANLTAGNASQTELKVSTNKPQLKKSLVRAEVHRDKDGVPQLPQTPQNVDETVLLSSDNTPSTSADKEPFRLSSNERKKIRRGLQASKLGQTSQTKVKFRVQAASSSRKQTPNYLIYIGKLAKDTTIPSLREHMLNIGVPNEDLADILDLNCRINNECLHYFTM